MRVTITFCYGERKTFCSTHKTNNTRLALQRAIDTHFGKGKGFYMDNGITTRDAWYGQIGHPLKGQNCASMDTGRVSVRFE